MTTPNTLAKLAARICLDVAELPDRNSPEDWPEAMLVTADELSDIVLSALTAQAPAAAEPFVLQMLVAAGHVTQEKVDEALAIAAATPGVVEPVAWKWRNKSTGARGCYFEDPSAFIPLDHPDYEWTLLYAAPQAAQQAAQAPEGWVPPGWQIDALGNGGSISVVPPNPGAEGRVVDPDSRAEGDRLLYSLAYALLAARPQAEGA